MRFRRIVTSLTGMLAVTAGLVAAPAPASALTGCPVPDGRSHCHAVGAYGPGFGHPPTYVNAVGANIEVDCLSVGDRYNEFANFEMWLNTNTNLGLDTWLEAGMTAGRLRYSPGNEQGFIWFWADMRPGNSYNEHYIAEASVGTYTNVAFYGEGGGNWGVYRAGTKVGTSVGVGANAGGGSLGAESTTKDATVYGNANSWGFYGLDNQWRYVSGESWVNTSNGWLSGYANGQYVHAQSPSCLGKASTPAPVRAWTADAAGFKDIAQRAAEATGTANPGSLTVVKSTRKAANALTGSEVNSDQATYVIQQTGTFTSPGGKAPAGKKAPRGNVLTITVDAATGQLLDLGVTDQAPNLAALGAVTSLS